MTICHKRKLIFIHIPKNAGTSIIKKMGWENSFMNAGIDDYRERYKNYWKNYKKFTVIRDPIDRFISAYKFARMEESGWFSTSGSDDCDKHIRYDICNKLDINEYVQYLYDNKNQFDIWTFPQTFFILNKYGKIEIDYFVRFDYLSKDLKKIGIEKIEKLNTSKINDNNAIKISDKSKKILYKIYEIDYKYLKFNFDNGINKHFQYQ